MLGIRWPHFQCPRMAGFQVSTEGNGRERVDTCGSAAFGEASRRAPARDHSITGILLAGDRGSPATEGRPGILSASPQQTPSDHCRTIVPSLSKLPSTTRACGADDIDPTHISAKRRHTPAAWMMTCAQTTILFPHRVTLTEHKWVTFGERRGSRGSRVHASR